MEYIINDNASLESFMNEVVHKHKLHVGDICIVNGCRLPFIGTISYAETYKHQYPCVYILKENGNIWFRHPKGDKEIFAMTMQYKLNQSASNTNNFGKSRDRIDKEIFVVPPSPNDNYLKLIIKNILMQKQIDLKDIKDKFDNVNHMNNMKRLITSNANLTYEKFVEWLEILGWSHKIDVYNENGQIYNV